MAAVDSYPENIQSMTEWIILYNQKQFIHTPHSYDYFYHNKNENRMDCLDLICKIHHSFLQCPNVMFLAINYFDRFSCSMVMAPDKRRLFSVVCLALACKYDQTDTRISSSSYLKYLPNQTLREFNQAERLILKVLDWNLTVTTIMNITQWFSQYHFVIIPTQPIALQTLILISEWSVSCPGHYKHRPITISMACYWISLLSFNKNLCTDEWMVHLLTISETIKMEFDITLSFVASIIIKQYDAWISNKTQCLFSTKKFSTEHSNKITQAIWSNNSIIKQFII